MEGLNPHVVDFAQIDDFLPELRELTSNLDEPFDYYMTLVRALYLDARRHGIKAVLDGIDGDSVLAEGSYLARLLRSGHWHTAYSEAVGQNQFWGGGYPAWSELYFGARAALVPDVTRSLAHRLLGRRREQRRLKLNIAESIIHPDFAAVG